jgi:phage terminase large subunit-like protein
LDSVWLFISCLKYRNAHLVHYANICIFDNYVVIYFTGITLRHVTFKRASVPVDVLWYNMFWTLKRHKLIGVFVVYIDTRSSMPISPSKSRDLADENNKILTEWKWFETTIENTSPDRDSNSQRKYRNAHLVHYANICIFDNYVVIYFTGITLRHVTFKRASVPVDEHK